jgi:general transcription factor IIIA
LRGAQRTSDRYFPPLGTQFASSPSRITQKKALTTHYNVLHLQKRDFACPHEGCGKSYGYKHLLRRHLVQGHRPAESSDCSSESEVGNAEGVKMTVNGITGRSYLERNSKIKRPLHCPHPNLPSQFTFDRGPELTVLDSMIPCEYVFGRAYDLRRHLLSEHGLAVEKWVVDAWAEERRKVASGVVGLIGGSV